MLNYISSCSFFILNSQLVSLGYMYTMYISIWISVSIIRNLQLQTVEICFIFWSSISPPSSICCRLWQYAHCSTYYSCCWIAVVLHRKWVNRFLRVSLVMLCFMIVIVTHTDRHLQAGLKYRVTISTCSYIESWPTVTKRGTANAMRETFFLSASNHIGLPVM